jgi:hypothetical protein
VVGEHRVQRRGHRDEGGEEGTRRNGGGVVDSMSETNSPLVCRLPDVCFSDDVAL